MPDTPVKIIQDGAITIIQINRPHVRNAIDRITADELRAAWLAFNADEEAKVGILTGGDEVFCAGADLKQMSSLSADPKDKNGPLGFTRLFINKPTIAAVAGYCVAGGLELAAWCDIRVADDSAVFGCFERRFGVPLIDGGTQRLPRLIGLGRALDMILTGRPVDAHEAKEMGLVNYLVPKGEHLLKAKEIALALAEFPQAALLNDRQAVYQGLGKSLPEGLKLEAELGWETIKTGESAAGAKAFTEGIGRGGEF